MKHWYLVKMSWVHNGESRMLHLSLSSWFFLPCLSFLLLWMEVCISEMITRLPSCCAYCICCYWDGYQVTTYVTQWLWYRGKQHSVIETFQSQLPWFIVFVVLVLGAVSTSCLSCQFEWLIYRLHSAWNRPSGFAEFPVLSSTNVGSDLCATYF